MNDHGLADFRVAHADVLDDLLTRTLAAFLTESLFDADEIVVDGTKVKASAGQSSYKRALRLDEAERAATARVLALKAEVDADPAASSKRIQAARERAARETQHRVDRARAKPAAVEAEKKKRAKRSPKEVVEKKEATASLTDPEARRMRCADGAVRASYNGTSQRPRIMALSLRFVPPTGATIAVLRGRWLRPASSGWGGRLNVYWQIQGLRSRTTSRLLAPARLSR